MAMETLEGGTHLDAVGLDGNEAMAGQLGAHQRPLRGVGTYVCSVVMIADMDSMLGRR
jgi:hypothetical protein